MSVTAAVLCAALWVSSHPATAQTGAAFPTDLSRYRNRNRLVFVFAPSVKDKRFSEQERLWQGKNAGFTERDLIPFFVLETGQSHRDAYLLPPGEAVALRKRFGIQANVFRVLLVGKDGNTAYSTVRPVPLQGLFGRIDAMPMRRDEMKQRKR